MELVSGRADFGLRVSSDENRLPLVLRMIDLGELEGDIGVAEELEVDEQWSHQI